MKFNQILKIKLHLLKLGATNTESDLTGSDSVCAGESGNQIISLRGGLSY